MEKKCCFTGYRPEKLPYLNEKEGEEYRNLYSVLEKAIMESIAGGYTYFISGFALGIDLMAAEIVLKLKKKYSNIFLEAALPCMNQTAGWSLKDKEHYYELLDAADKKICIDTIGSRESFFKRNRYMVDGVNRVIAAYDGKRGGTRYTVNYALKNKKEVLVIDPNTFQTNVL